MTFKTSFVALAVLAALTQSAAAQYHIAQRSVRVRLGAEGREGLSAFVEKRLPNWMKPAQPN